MQTLLDRVMSGPPVFDEHQLRALEPEAFCREVLPHVSRTFALSVPVLPEPANLNVTVAYLLCRMADTIEDSPFDAPHERHRAFDLLAEAVADPVRGAGLQELSARLRTEPAYALLFERGADVLAVLAAMTPAARCAVVRCVREMIEGMRRTPPPASAYGEAASSTPVTRMFASVEDLEGYCHYVAGIVGLMLLEMFEDILPPGTSARELRPLAHRFGLGLQLVNILVDQHADASAGRAYVPEGLAGAGGTLTDRARRHLDAALEFTLALPADPPGYRMFCLLPLFFSLRTLRAFETQQGAVRPRMSREEVMDTARRAMTLRDDDTGIRDWYARERGPAT